MISIQETSNNSHLNIADNTSFDRYPVLSNITSQFAEQKARTKSRILLQLRNLNTRANAENRHADRIGTLKVRRFNIPKDTRIN